MGGKAYLAMEDRVETGRAYSFFRQELEGLSIAKIYTRYLTPVPGKPSVRERQNFGKDESSGVLFNQDGAWEITFRGARLLEPKRIENWRDGTLRNIFYILRQRLERARHGLLLARQRSLRESAGGDRRYHRCRRPHRDGLLQRVHQAAGPPGAEAPQSRVQGFRHRRDDLRQIPRRGRRRHVAVQHPPLAQRREALRDLLRERADQQESAKTISSRFPRSSKSCRRPSKWGTPRLSNSAIARARPAAGCAARWSPPRRSS